MLVANNPDLKGVWFKATQGTSYVDNETPTYRLSRDLPEARAHGLKIGFYHYSENGTNDPISEYAHFSATAFPLSQPDDRYALDYEDPQASSSQPTWALAFLARLATDVGINRTWIYTGSYYLPAMGLTWEDFAAYKRWVAFYSDTPPTDVKSDLWQYTGSGRLTGIEGEVDLSLELV